MGATRKCVVLNCVNNCIDKKNKTSSFHELPSDEKLRRKWLKKLKPYMDPHDKRDLLTVCGNHFEKKYFKQSKKKMLTRDAVPTIFKTKKSISLVTSSDNEENQSTSEDGADSAYQVDENEETRNIPHLPIPVKEEESKYLFDSVKIYIDSGKTEVCRVCFKSAPTHKKLTEHHVTRTETYKEMMEFLSLDINLDFYPEPVICVNCVMHLLHAFDFKKKCQKTEKNLKKYYSNRSSDERPINLLIVAYRENSDQATVEQNAVLADHDYDQKKGDVETVQMNEVLVEKKPPPAENRLKRGTIWGEPPYLCDVCGRTFQCHIQCRRHLRAHAIQKETVESYFCEKCQCSYANINVQIHMNSHRVKFECDVCGRRFARSSMLVNHVQDVHQKAAYVFCSVCGKTCLRKQLKAHMARHSDKKDAQCNICDRMVYRLRLRQHIRAHFKHKSLSVCHICGKSVVRNHMTSHLKSHGDGNRKFKCALCDVGFSTQKKLQEHAGSKKHLKNLMLQEVAKKSEGTG